jgi:hypothetical protein
LVIASASTEPECSSPEAGSFTYDAAVPRFSDFFVDWNGTTFDLRATTNAFNPLGCGGASGPAAGFAILTGSGNGAVCDLNEWYGESTKEGRYFRFYINRTVSPFNTAFLNEHIIDSDQFTPKFDGGPYMVAAAAPEPGTFVLLGAAVGMLALRRRIRAAVSPRT